MASEAILKSAPAEAAAEVDCEIQEVEPVTPATEPQRKALTPFKVRRVDKCPTGPAAPPHAMEETQLDDEHSAKACADILNPFDWYRKHGATLEDLCPSLKKFFPEEEASSAAADGVLEVSSGDEYVASNGDSCSEDDLSSFIPSFWRTGSLPSDLGAISGAAMGKAPIADRHDEDEEEGSAAEDEIVVTSEEEGAEKRHTAPASSGEGGPEAAMPATAEVQEGGSAAEDGKGGCQSAPVPSAGDGPPAEALAATELQEASSAGPERKKARRA